jgi:hypothetical protein
MIPHHPLVELAMARQSQLHREAAEHRIAAELRRCRRRIRRRPSPVTVPVSVPLGSALP